MPTSLSATAGSRPAERDAARNARAVARLDAAQRAALAELRCAQRSVTAEYLEVARAIARRYRCRPQDRADLQQVAYLGLVKAVKRFDSAHGDDVVGFAAPTIAGEIKRHLRDSSWSVRPPRGLQELSSELRESIPELAQRLGHEPSLAEIAAETGHSRERIARALECARSRQALSLDAPIDADGATPLSELLHAPADDFERADLSITLEAALRRLSPADRRVIHLRFSLDLTQREIAAECGVSQMQISRRLASILGQLRIELAAWADEE